jgi:hypothetical protein
LSDLSGTADYLDRVSLEADQQLTSALLTQSTGSTSDSENQNLKAMIAEGTAAKADNFSTFTFDDDGNITFYFTKGQVAPAYFGEQTVTLPVGTLTSNPTPVATTTPVVATTTATSSMSGIANPASTNCVSQGGQVQLMTMGNGGQIGVCVFEDNLQCEEWALMSGKCKAPGVKITGYATQAAQYCAIIGGEYTFTKEAVGDATTGPNAEQGTCKLLNGATVNVWDLWNGTYAYSTN